MDHLTAPPINIRLVSLFASTQAKANIILTTGALSPVAIKFPITSPKPMDPVPEGSGQVRKETLVEEFILVFIFRGLVKDGGRFFAGIGKDGVPKAAIVLSRTVIETVLTDKFNIEGTLDFKIETAKKRNLISEETFWKIDMFRKSANRILHQAKKLKTEKEAKNSIDHMLDFLEEIYFE